MFPNAPKGEWNRYHLFFDLQIGFSEVSSVEILGILTKGKYETRNHKELIYSDLINVKQLEIETHEGKINRFTLTQFIKNKIANQEFRTLLNTKAVDFTLVFNNVLNS